VAAKKPDPPQSSLIPSTPLFLHSAMVQVPHAMVLPQERQIVALNGSWEKVGLLRLICDEVQEQ
jgi:hypothetical protein